MATTTVREAIRAKSRIARMRMGQDVGDTIDIPSMPGVRATLVPLTEAEAQAGLIRAATIDVTDNTAGLMARNRASMESDVWNALRELGDINAKVFDSIEDMTGPDGLEPDDIDHIHEALAVLMDYASPAIDGMSEADFADLKKAFAQIDLNALSGREWAAVKLACRYLFPNLLRAKLLGTYSTESSTERSENEESI